jgi:predicted nucleic-acid-binding Zn-ribbon protein
MSPDPSTDSGCEKCGHDEATVDKIATSGGGLSKLFDIQNRGFQTVSCTNCGYTELYKSDAGTSNLVDVFLG